MQTATILYRTHATPSAEQPLCPAAAGFDPTWTELAEGGPRAINEALLRLVSRGAGLVEAVAFSQGDDGAIRFGGARTRLFG